MDDKRRQEFYHLEVQSGVVGLKLLILKTIKCLKLFGLYVITLSLLCILRRRLLFKVLRKAWFASILAPTLVLRNQSFVQVTRLHF